jgi:hypothetical protein
MQRLFFCFSLAAAGCANEITTLDSPGHLEGSLTLKSGNCMPVSPPCKVTPLSGVTVWLYEPIPAEGKDTKYPDVSDFSPLYEARSDSDGHYAIEAPAGDYTVLVDDEGYPYAGATDGGVLRPAHVEEERTTTLDLQIDHAVE